MSELMRMWVEVGFNVTYLAVVWALVLIMALQRGRVGRSKRPLAIRVVVAFALLALGDTGHVGFRVVAYAMGGLEANPSWLG
jgi:hypothetical protein